MIKNRTRYRTMFKKLFLAFNLRPPPTPIVIFSQIKKIKGNFFLFSNIYYYISDTWIYTIKRIPCQIYVTTPI